VAAGVGGGHDALRVRMVYVDESYCRACYYVAALLVPETERRSLSTALDDVVGRATRSFPGLESTAELHGYDMFHGVRDWGSAGEDAPCSDRRV
jgi:hypothetical protein